MEAPREPQGFENPQTDTGFLISSTAGFGRVNPPQPSIGKSDGDFDVFYKARNGDIQVPGYIGQQMRVDSLAGGLAGQELQKGETNIDGNVVMPMSRAGAPPAHQKWSFDYAICPTMPLLAGYLTADALVNGIYQWGQELEEWARGLKSFQIQLQEVVKLGCHPSFEVTDSHYSCVVTLPKTDQDNRDLENAIYRASLAIDGGIPPIFGFSISGSPILPAPPIPAVQFHSRPDLATPAKTPFGSIAHTGHHLRDSPNVNDSPTPRGRGARGRGARGHGGAAARGKNTKSRATPVTKRSSALNQTPAPKNTPTPKRASVQKKALTPRKRATPKRKASDEKSIRQEPTDDEDISENLKKMPAFSQKDAEREMHNSLVAISGAGTFTAPEDDRGEEYYQSGPSATEPEGIKQDSHPKTSAELARMVAKANMRLAGKNKTLYKLSSEGQLVPMDVEEALDTP